MPAPIFPTPTDLRGLVDRLAVPAPASLDSTLADIAARERAKASGAAAPPPPLVIQDFTPLFDSLEADLAAIYWETIGTGAFAANEVPFIINNDGQISQDAAELLYANCHEAASGSLATVGHSAQPIEILELGAGTGLFALYLLDAFRALCRERGADYYDRLTCYVTDGSPRIVEHWQALRQFADHADRVVLGTCDALDPAAVRRLDGRTIPLANLRAVFANYLLDVLPATVIRCRDGVVEQLCLRTLVDDPAELRKTDPGLDAGEIARLGRSVDRADRERLLPVIDALRFETAFVPVGPDRPPFLDEAARFGRDLPRLLHNFGALQCLHNALGRLDPGGFVLVNDFGPTTAGEVPTSTKPNRFGASLAMGVNFPLIEHCLADSATISAPQDDGKRSIHSRLLQKRAQPATLATYLATCGRERWFFEDESAPLARARKEVEAGRAAEALDLYREVLAEAPGNWLVMGELAQFLVRQGEPAQAVHVAGLAVRRNPWYSAWLWNILGDALFAGDRIAEAHEAYEQAIAVNPSDAVAHFSLSFTLTRAGRHREALEALARALAFDVGGTYRERILEQQQHVLRALAARWSTDQYRRAQRTAAFD